MTKELSQTERYQLAAGLIKQSPPGQVNDVIAALQIIVNDNSDEFKQEILRRLTEYHREQLQAISLPGSSGNALISEASALSSNRYVDPKSKQSFALDHFSLNATDLQPHIIADEPEAFRSELDTSLTVYLQNHFSSSESTGAVFCSASPQSSSIITEPVPVPSEPSPLVAEAVQEETSPEQAVEATNEDASETEIKKVESSSEEAASGILAAVSTAVADTVEGIKEAVSGEVPIAAAETREDAGLGMKEEAQKADELSSGMSEVATKPVDPIESKVEQPVVPAEEKVEEKIAVSEEDPIYTVCIVGNRYNVNNFWTGRWRSIWTVDPKQSEFEGKVYIDVHYFEAGNVQLNTNQTFKLPLPAAGPKQAAQIIQGIGKVESDYQLKLAEINQLFADREFKSLRRALPMTKTKIDWDKHTYRMVVPK